MSPHLPLPYGWTQWGICSPHGTRGEHSFLQLPDTPYLNARVIESVSLATVILLYAVPFMENCPGDCFPS